MKKPPLIKSEYVFPLMLLSGLIVGFVVGRLTVPVGHRFVHVGSQYSSLALDTKTGMTCIARPKPIDLSAGLEPKTEAVPDPIDLSAGLVPKDQTVRTEPTAQKNEDVFDHVAGASAALTEPPLPYCGDL